MKVDVKALRFMKEVQKLAEEFFGKEPIFCDVCGETNPESGFYPSGYHGPDTIICGNICNDCDRELSPATIGTSIDTVQRIEYDSK